MANAKLEIELELNQELLNALADARAENERLHLAVDAMAAENKALRAEAKDVDRLRRAIDDAILLIDVDRRSDAYTLLCNVVEKR